MSLGTAVGRMDFHRIASHLVPALLGVSAALGLGGAGFALGCLYAGVTAPDAPPAQVVRAPSPPAPDAVAAVQAPAAGMGGPDDADPLATDPETVVPAPPAVSAVLRPGQAIAMGRPVLGGWVSSRFGQRMDPFTGRPAIHRGLDFAGADHSDILAVAPGVLTWSGQLRGYGNLIEIDHGRGWVTRYGHNASNLVRPGDYVKAGETIALMGSTGRATGTHVHFEVLYRGRHQNPARFVPQAT